MAGALAPPGVAFGGWGNENWGEFVWQADPAPVPLLWRSGVIALVLLLLLTPIALRGRLRRHASLLIIIGLLLVPHVAIASDLTVTHTFVNGETADADQVNTNFDDVETAVNDNDSRLNQLKLDLGSKLTVNDLSVVGDANVQGGTNLEGPLSVVGNADFAGAAAIGNTLNVVGAVMIAGALAVASSADVAGTVTIGNDLDVQGNATVGGAVVIGSNATIAGNLDVLGMLKKGAGMFRIDHPLDPANKTLSHSFVESDEYKNVYDGVVILGENGRGSVELPSWFEALNRDFRYQLTPIGAPAPGLYVAKEITHGSLEIAGGVPGLKVCWQVTGVRQDRYVTDHPLEVEEDKPLHARGTFLYPEGFQELVASVSD